MVQVQPPKGYNLNDEEIKIELPYTAEDNMTTENHITVNPKITEIRKNIILTKVDGKNLPVGNAVFEVTRSETETGEFSPFATQGSDNRYTTDESGQIILQNVPFGWYSFKEVEAPEGFMLSNEEYKVEVFSSSPEDTEININAVNYKEPSVLKEIKEKPITTPDDPYMSEQNNVFHYNLIVDLPEDIKDYKKFEITDILDNKLALKNNDLYDLVITDENDIDISANFTKSIEGNTLKIELTNFTGVDAKEKVKISFKALIRGNTKSGEVIENKYSLNFTNKWGNNKEIVSNSVFVEAPNNKIELTKIDGTDSTPLDGVDFELYYGDKENGGTLIGTMMTTQAGGKIIWDNLSNGHYYLHEIKTLDGYRLLDKPYLVVVNNDSHALKTTQVELKNYKENIFIPNTGTMGALGFVLIGSAFFVASTIVKRKGTE